MRCTAPTLMLFVASVLVVRAVGGQTPGSSAMNPPGAQAPGSPAVSQSSQRESLVADIVFVGVIENVARLAHELGELLSARGMAPRFQQRAVVSENELAAQQNANDPSRGTVWILEPNPSMARLVFADRAHLRFLIRDIPLLQGMDDVGRESVEQIIESSFLALLQGAAAISRDEVHAAMGQYMVPVAIAPPASAQPQAPLSAQHREPLSAPPSPVPPAQHTPSVRTRRTLTQRLGIGYGVNLSGSDFGIEHGPEILAGVELVRQRDSLFATGAFDWHFPQHHRSLEFDLRIQSSRVWLLFGWRKPIQDFTSFVATAGPGIGVTQVQTTSNAPLANPESISSRVTPGARLQSGLEWGNSPLVIQLLLMTDLSFHEPQYDITRDRTKEVLARSWLLRPGAIVGVMWR